MFGFRKRKGPPQEAADPGEACPDRRNDRGKRTLPRVIRNAASWRELGQVGISARQLAAEIDVSPSRISELVNGQRPITADTALRLGLFFGMGPRFWLNLQSEYDIRVAGRELRAKLSTRIRIFQPVAE
jgi:addiction module HigA family antidote